jgi:hypothetical protein
VTDLGREGHVTRSRRSSPSAVGTPSVVAVGGGTPRRDPDRTRPHTGENEEEEG